MKKIIATMIMAVLMVSLFVGCGTENKKDTTKASSEGTADDSLKYVMDKKVLILGLDASFPPMGYKNENDEIVGFDIDLAKEVCKRMGVELKLQPIDWDSKEMELNDAKSIDCIWNGMSYSEERAQSMTLSPSYMNNRQVVVVLAESTYNTLADLSGKTLALQSGSTAAEAVDGKEDFKNSLKEVIKIDDNVKAMMDLEVGGSDAVAMDEIVARYYMTKNEGKFRVLDETLSDEQYVIGFRKGDQALCDEVVKALKNMAADGTLKTISETWFDSDITSLK